ncbi:protein-glucosylgalactosylhydroxylysine glucosidase isoform X2 [Perognathus longimembris pacificus]|uniref:protein-glucosylgalactosylhydroxylysine glucosidase isoform X2 n=1 Tax=Perognathus longimembris pacificus TaxID=214514 RepID=UPI002019289B|nr:protein-glucosylgalactosylhydroxylysine glucosidase isoform X2 [Perognathus longimembris pacificus]
MEDDPEDPTIFTAHSLPRDPRLLAPVTNAYLGTRVYHDTLHVNGVYNGVGGHTHRAILPSPLNTRLEVPAGTGEQLTETFILDTNTGSFLHTLEGLSFRISQRIYAHRTLPHLLAFSVSIERLAAGSWPITVLLHSSFSPESPDLDLHLGPDFQEFRYLYGHILTPEQPGEPQQELHMLWTPVPSALTLGKREEDRTWDFLTVVGSSQAEAQACLDEVLQLQAQGTLYIAHAQAWAQLWADCGLDVVGPLALRQALRGSLYYLLSALPQPGTQNYICHGLSPGGLSNGSQEECYWGHIFWDQDLWMFPNVLMFHPEAARAILEYRIRTLGGALENARNLGYQGAKFAWESAGSGLEVCPEDIYGVQEVHINGAVVLAFQLYYLTTQDLQLFREAGGWEVVSAVAEFWCSRVEWSSKDNEYHLKGVMPPDEYHAGVNNSVYTNVLVQNSLRFAAALAQDLGLSVPDQWLVVADKIKVPFNPEKNFHPEFDGYEPEHVCCGMDGTEGPSKVTGLSGQELRLCHGALQGVDRECRWVGCCELSDRHGGLPAGSAFRMHRVSVITEAGVTFDPLCPAGVSGVHLSGLSYQGNKLNFTFSEDYVTIEVTAQAGPWAPPLEAELWPSQAVVPLPLGHKVSFPHSGGRIQRAPQ